MIGITTRIYRGFAIHIECNRDATPPCRATIRRRFWEAHPRPGMLKGASEEDVADQAKAAIDGIMAREPS
jgi:hypothetical protein